MDYITRYCDLDGSGEIERAERVDTNTLWDFGTSSLFPVLRCTPGGTGKQDPDFDGLASEEEEEGCDGNEDCDGDGVLDGKDLCHTPGVKWTSDSSNDPEGDGCRNSDQTPPSG